MSQSAHTSTTQGSSLEERIQNYRTAQQNYNNIKASDQLKDNREWINRLGTEEELQFANQVAKNSLLISVQVLTEKDLNQAKHLNLLSEQEQEQIQELNPPHSPEKNEQISENKERINAARDKVRNTSKGHDKSRG